MQTAVVAFLVAWIATLMIVRWRHRHLALSSDTLVGLQKFHTGAVPRVGGVGVVLGLVAALGWSVWRGILDDEAGWLLLASTPAFAAGLMEDLTKRVEALPRLLATMAAAGLGAWLLGAQLPRVGVLGLDAVLAWGPAGFLVTLVAVAGVTNAINIIDGFNGLAAAVAMLMFVAFGYVGWSLGDAFIVQVCLAMIGALMGFFVWNYPRGLVFLGDGGAYLVGFVLAEVAVLLVVRHPTLSPWFCFLVCAYPITETLFSIYRRRFLRGTSPGLPDALHLHTLIYRRLVRWAPGRKVSRDLTARNSATSPYLWGLASASIIPAVLFWRSQGLLLLSTAMFVVVYAWLYVRLVRFRTPRWWRRRVGQ